MIITEPATTPMQWQMPDRSTFALPNEIYLQTIPQKKRALALQVINQIEQVLSERVAVPLCWGGQLSQPCSQLSQRLSALRVSHVIQLRRCVRVDPLDIAHGAGTRKQQEGAPLSEDA